MFQGIRSRSEFLSLAVSLAWDPGLSQVIGTEQ